MLANFMPAKIVGLLMLANFMPENFISFIGFP
jgi:hypothetical protein